MKEKINSMILAILILASVIVVTGSVVFIIKADPTLLSLKADHVKSVSIIFGIAMVTETILIATAIGLGLFEGLVKISEAMAWRNPYVSR